MLYVPGKLLFIHIPRTAGNAITRTLGTELLKTESPVIVLEASVAAAKRLKIHRHSTAAELRPLIHDFDRILKVAVNRPTSEIIESDYRLHRAFAESANLPHDWDASVRMARDETLDEFKARRWDKWLCGRTAWQHWCHDEENKPMGVISLDFDTLSSHGWPLICQHLNIDIPLPHDDWQIQRTEYFR